MDDLAEKTEQAIWIAKTLFEGGYTRGSTGNLSFRHENHIVMSASGCCFGRLCAEDFSRLDLSGNVISGKKPSKEYPLHLQVYQKNRDAGAVIHTHGRHSVLWSCLEGLCEEDCMPEITPYLHMKLGAVGLVPYAPPGSEALFHAFEQRLGQKSGWLLKRHGAIVSGGDLLSAFYACEELEETAYILWELRKETGVYFLPIEAD